MRGLFAGAGRQNKLDATAVHPESYEAAQKLLELCGFSAQDIGTSAVQTLPEKARAMGMEELARQTAELMKDMDKGGRA